MAEEVKKIWFPEVWQIEAAKNPNYLQSLWIGIVMPIIWLPKALFNIVLWPTAKCLIGGFFVLGKALILLPAMGIAGMATGIDRPFPQVIIKEFTPEEFLEVLKKQVKENEQDKGE